MPKGYLTLDWISNAFVLEGRQMSPSGPGGKRSAICGPLDPQSTQPFPSFALLRISHLSLQSTQVPKGVLFQMPFDRSHEELLRIDVASAARSLDAARDLLSSVDLTPEEATANYRAAFRRYATALRRFSDLVVDGKLPG